MLVVRGALRPLASMAVITRRSAADCLQRRDSPQGLGLATVNFVQQAEGGAARAPRTAVSPPGRRKDLKLAIRSNPPAATAGPAAPDCPVRAVTGTVPRYAQDRTLQAVFRHAREYMRKVVLHRGHGQTLFQREARAGVIRMQIVNNAFRRHLEKPLHTRDGPLKGLQRPHIFQVADVLARKMVPPLLNATVFLDGRPCRVRRAGPWPPEAARAHSRARGATSWGPPWITVTMESLTWRAIWADCAPETRPRYRAADPALRFHRCRRLLAQIAARHNKRAIEGRQQQVMQRCIGEHDAQDVRAYVN